MDTSIYYLMMHFDNHEVARLLHVSAEFHRLMAKSPLTANVFAVAEAPQLNAVNGKLWFTGSDLAVVEVPHLPVPLAGYRDRINKQVTGYDTFIEAARALANERNAGGVCQERSS